MYPRAFIVSTGSEITQGLYADTNAMELSRLLKQHGFRVVGHAVAPDEADRIEATLRSTFGHCELLLVTGGLGPTEDDLNREIIARITGRELKYVHRAEVMMRALFTRRNRQMPDRNKSQAFIPEHSTCLLNFWGTAPGFVVPAEHDRPMIVAMPGVPVEWRGMVGRYFERHVLAAFPNRPATAWWTFGVLGLPESEVNALLADMFGESNLDVGLLAQGGIISVRLLATAGSREECREALECGAAEVRRRLPANKVFYDSSEPVALETGVIELFRAANKRIALAESCTGGGVARRLTSVAGSSEVLLESIVSYSNEAKKQRLGVSQDVLEQFGAVSQECVEMMAVGALGNTAADVSLSVSGIAGPGGGTAEKPVGLVWFALADRTGGKWSLQRLLPGDRDGIRQRAELQALDMLRRWVTGLPIDSDADEV